jgi:anti-sigma B factor antagonist
VEAVVDLQMSVRPGRACTVVRVSGELDMDSSPMLEDCLREVIDAGARRVVLDFAGVTFMDSSGLSLLVQSLKRLGDLGGRLCLADVQKPVRYVLVLSAVDTVLCVYDAVAAAEDDMPPLASESVR